MFSKLFKDHNRYFFTTLYAMSVSSFLAPRCGRIALVSFKQGTKKSSPSLTAKIFQAPCESNCKLQIQHMEYRFFIPARTVNGENDLAANKLGVILALMYHFSMPGKGNLITRYYLKIP